MYRFYCKPEEVVEGTITLTGTDVNHIKNVLRMRCGEDLVVCDENGKDYNCRIDRLEPDRVVVRVESVENSETELPIAIKLYQGLPKKDKMDLIVQKAVELGVTEIIPITMKRCVVKLEDEKKEAKKLERWRAIAEGAAKQSGRGIIPSVSNVLPYKEALKRAKEQGMLIIPYELAAGMRRLKDVIRKIQNDSEQKVKTLSIFIGPEGGFDISEIEAAIRSEAATVSLGKRILRTETAGLTMLSILMYEMECKLEEQEWKLI